MSESNPVGRPPKYASIEQMQPLIDAYFAERLKDDKPISVTGLALALDCTREMLDRYQDQEEFRDPIKKAKLRVENFYEERLTLANATGSIFALKNFGWKDTHTHAGDKQNPLSLILESINGSTADLPRDEEIPK